MTGFGKAIFENENLKVAVELKSVNGKSFDIKVRMPSSYNEKEIELRSFLNKYFERGSFELIVSAESISASSNLVFNKQLALKYYNEFNSFLKENKIDEENNLLNIIAKLPDVFKSDKSTADEKEWNFVFETIKKASEKVDASRKNEGLKLEKEFKNYIDRILKLLKEVEKHDSKRLSIIKEQLQKKLTENIDKSRIDENRLEQELIYYIEKLDITEEKVRLKSNCSYFLETIAQKESQGKKLTFISQEIGREINTIGSKANNINIQKIVVQMKDELEKIKEQLMNVL